MTRVQRTTQKPQQQPPTAPSSNGTHGVSNKLSDIILRGAQYHPQSFERFSTGDATCVLGAAFEGIFGPDAFQALPTGVGVVGHIQRYVPELTEPCYSSCPVCGLPEAWRIESPPLSAWLIHLNDAHHLSRERIAAELKKMGL